MEYKCRLKIIFAEKEISQKDFAANIGITQSALSGIVNGKRLPEFNTAYKICEVLNLNLHQIWIKKERSELFENQSEQGAN
jgi:putative transcriptional regulator